MDDVNQKKKMILLGIACVGVLAVVLLIVLFVLMANESKKIKVQIGDVVYKTKTVRISDPSSGTYFQQTSIIDNSDKSETPFILTNSDGVNYYNIKTMAEKFCGYVYNKGIYGGVPDESFDKCHIVSKGERVSFSSGSDEISKYIETPERLTGELEYKDSLNRDRDKKEEDVEIISINSVRDRFRAQGRYDEPNVSPVILFNNQLYATRAAMEVGFNMAISESPDNPTITLFPLETLVDGYSKVLSNSNFKLTTNFKNQRALFEDLAVCEENGSYCVVNVKSSTNLNKVISSQYSAIEYVQGIGNFITGTVNKQTGTLKFGMNSPENGKVIIPANYEFLQLLDAKNDLYLTKSNDLYGIINPTKEDNPVILEPIYEQIGLDSVTEYANQGITNKYIIDNYTIVIKKDGKFGLATKDGYTLIRPRYQEFGCSNPSEILKKANGTEITANPTLIIPLPNDLKCIVVKDNDKYGLLDLKRGSIILQAYYTAIYSAQGNGQTNYYFHKVRPGDSDQVETLDQKLKSTKELIRFIENFSGKEQSEEALKKQSDKENALMEKEAEDNSEEEPLTDDSEEEYYEEEQYEED